MKTITAILSISLLLHSCDSASKNSTISNKAENNDQSVKNNITSLKGAWELVGYYNYADNVVTDSFSTSEGYRQVKMYTASKVMWSKSFPLDSSEWFGYGSYKLDGNELVEILDYGSEMMRRIIQEKKEFTYETVITENGFSQIEMDDDGNKIYAENYKRIE